MHHRSNSYLFFIGRTVSYSSPHRWAMCGELPWGSQNALLQLESHE